MGITEFIENRPKLAGLLIFIIGYISGIVTFPIVVVLFIAIVILAKAISVYNTKKNRTEEKKKLGEMIDEREDEHLVIVESYVF